MTLNLDGDRYNIMFTGDVTKGLIFKVNWDVPNQKTVKDIAKWMDPMEIRVIDDSKSVTPQFVVEGSYYKRPLPVCSLPLPFSFLSFFLFFIFCTSTSLTTVPSPQDLINMSGSDQYQGIKTAIKTNV